MVLGITPNTMFVYSLKGASAPFFCGIMENLFVKKTLSDINTQK